MSLYNTIQAGIEESGLLSLMLSWASSLSGTGGRVSGATGKMKKNQWPEMTS